MHNRKKLLYVLLLAIGSLPQISSDIYTPSLPAIAAQLSVSIHLAQGSLAIYLFGLAPALLVWGAISDSFGRKIPILCGISILCIGSLICAFAHTIDMLYIGRVVQGIGGASGSALFRAILRDVYHGNDLAHAASIVGNTIILTTVGAPFLGGFFEVYLGWRFNFIFLIFYSFGVFLLVLTQLTETGPIMHRRPFSISSIKASYKEIFSSTKFIGSTLAVFINFGCLFSWLTLGPVLLIHELGLKPSVYGALMLIVSIPMFLSGLTNAYWVKEHGVMAMLLLGWGVTIVAGLFMLVSYYLYGLNIYDVIIPVVIAYYGISFIWPNIFSIAVTPFGHLSAYAGASYAFVQFSGGVVFATVFSYLGHTTSVPLAVCLILGPIVAWSILQIFVGKDLKLCNTLK